MTNPTDPIEHGMERDEKIPSVGLDFDQPYRPGVDPVADAWYTSFFIENHLDYYAYPQNVASPEQIRFIAYTEKNERYYPCSDRMFQMIMKRRNAFYLREEYRKVLKKVFGLIDLQIEDLWEKEYLKALVHTKYEHETRDNIMIPSRLEKRLLHIYLNHTQIEDPCLCEKVKRNLRVSTILASEAVKKAIDKVDDAVLLSYPVGLEEITERAQYLKLRRLFALSVENDLWESENTVGKTTEGCLRLFARPITGNGEDALWNFLGVRKKGNGKDKRKPKKILWLANEAGEIMIDLAIIRYLVELGHKVIVSFKEGPWFTKVDFYDAQSDETLNGALENPFFIEKRNLGKNELVRILKSDYPIMVIPDGTSENLNFLLTSTTFARIFKEVDGVISKGEEQRRRLFDTHFGFTQEIFNIAKDAKGAPSLLYKPRHPSVIKFTHKELEKKAQAIIAQMQKAKDEGMTVMFYSGIIGSIPGKEAVAIKIMSTSVHRIMEQSASTFIINPSEHSEPGMDADDLMFMWEIVQRSGFIDIWRFQTYEDIVEAFATMNTKIPPEWVGKDATYSTGCTKEMNIALDVQNEHPEMQISGPAKEKFLRRKEYGIGKMYDQRLKTLCQL